MARKWPNTAELRAAHRLLEPLARPGTRVIVGSMGREHEATVTGSRLSDGQYGSWESLTVHASLGAGRYTFDLTPHNVASGTCTVRRAEG